MDADPTVVAEFDDPDDAAWEVEQLALHHIDAEVRTEAGRYLVTVAAGDHPRAEQAQATDDSTADDAATGPAPELPPAEEPGRAAVERAANLISVCVFWPPVLVRVVRLLVQAAPVRLGAIHRTIWLFECGFVGLVAFVVCRVLWGWVVG